MIQWWQLSSRVSFFACLCMLTSACGDNRTGGPPPTNAGPDARPAADVDAGADDPGATPALDVLFPTPQSRTDGPTIAVRGTASHARGVAGVWVNNTLATSDDGYATWTAEVSLEHGDNQLYIAVADTDDELYPAVAELRVERVGAALFYPRGLAFDAAGQRIFAVAAQQHAIISLDLTSGQSAVVTSETRGEGPPMPTYPESIAWDAANDRILLVDDLRVDGVVAVDPSTGDRTVLSDGNDPAMGPELSTLGGIAVDEVRNRALIISRGSSHGVYAVDLDSGQRAQVSGDDVGSGAPLDRPRLIAVASARGRAYVADYYGAIIDIDLATGARALLGEASGGTSPRFQRIFGLTYDPVGHRLYVWDPDAGQLYSVDPDTGASVPLTGGGLGTGPKIGACFGLTWNGAQVVLGDRIHDALLTVDPATGDRTEIFTAKTGEGPLLGAPVAALLDDTGDIALVADADLRALLALDVKTGTRWVINDESDGGAPMDRLLDMAWDRAGERAFLIGSIPLGGFAWQLELHTVDLSQGLGPTAPMAGRVTHVISGPANCWSADYHEDVGLVVACSDDGGMYRLDPDTGKVDHVYSYEWPPVGTGPSLLFPSALRLDPLRGRAVYFDERRDGLFHLKLASGERQWLRSWGSSQSYSPFPRVFDLDVPNDRAIVVDGRWSSVLSMDLTSDGGVVELSSNLTHFGPEVAGAHSIAVDWSRERALIADGMSRRQALVLVDLRTGQRVIVAR